MNEKPGVFYKKVSIDDGEQMWSDTAISTVYSDIFDGNSVTSDIAGGIDSQLYVSESFLPFPDSFGSSELVGLKYFIYPTDINFEKLNSFTPEFKLWNVKMGMGSSSEGTLTPSIRDLTVFTSYSDPEAPTYGENFKDGVPEIERRRAKMIYKSGDAFLLLGDAHDLLRRTSKHWSKEGLMKRYGEEFQGQQIIRIKKEWKIAMPVLGRYTSSVINLVKDPNWDTAASAATQGMIEKVWRPMNGKKFWTFDVSWINHQIEDKIKYSLETEETIEVTLPVKGGDTVFSDIYSRGDGLWLEGEDMAMKARAEFSSDRVLSGGQALKLHTIWDVDAAPGSSISPQTLDAPGRNSATLNRQEVVCVMDMPHPQPIDTIGSPSRREDDLHVPRGINHDSKISHDAGLTGQYFTIDFNIEKLDYQYEAGSPHVGRWTGGSDGTNHGIFGDFDNTAWLRGFAVLFSVTKPTAEETFYDFVERCTGGDDSMSERQKIPKGRHEFEEHGTFTGFYIGKYNWSFDRPDGAAANYVDSPKNVQNSRFSKNPILCFPYRHNSSEAGAGYYTGSLDYGIGGDGNDGPSWRCCNLGQSGASEGDEQYKFHETIGKTVYYFPGYNSGWYNNEGFRNSVCELVEDTWYRASVCFPPGASLNTLGKPQLKFYNASSNEPLTHSLEMDLAGSQTGVSSIGAKDLIASEHPKYVSIWLINYPGTRHIPKQLDDTDQRTPKDVSHGTSASPWKAENIVHVDNLAFWGFNNNIINNTVTDNNEARGDIKLNPVYTYSSDFGQTVTEEEGELSTVEHHSGMQEPIQSSTYISIGFDNQNDFDKYAGLNNGNYLFFSGFKNSSSNYEALHHIELGSGNDAVDTRNLRAGFTSSASGYPDNPLTNDEQNYGEKLGHQHSHFFFETSGSLDPAEHGEGSQGIRRRGLQFGGTSNRGFDMDGTTGIDYFNQKGMVKIDFDSSARNYGMKYDGTNAKSAKRENIFVSARILDVEHAKEGTIVVDNPSIFNLPDDTEYVIYKRYHNGNEFFDDSQTYGSTGAFDTTHTSQKTGPYALSGIKVITRNENEITFNKDLRWSNYGYYYMSTSEWYTKGWLTTKIKNGGDKYAMCFSSENDNIKPTNLWISPLKYWLVMEIYNTSSEIAGQAGVGRTYDSILTVNRAQNNYPTSADYGTTFNEFLFSDAAISSNKWDLTPTVESAIETSIDYGFGSLDEGDEDTGGYVTKFIPKAIDIPIAIDASPIIKQGKYEPGETVTTLLSSSHGANTTTLTIATADNTSSYKRPYLLVKYKDEIPTVDEFQVNPDEENPFFPKFTWSCGDDDAWYGFIIIDRNIPKHQYHGAFMHIPMNRPIKSTENLFSPWPPDKSVDTDYDIYDYVNDNHNYYGYKKKYWSGAEFNTSTSRWSDPIENHDKFPASWGKPEVSINSEYTFLDPEGLSGWCHRFDGIDQLFADYYSPAPSGLVGDSGVLRGDAVLGKEENGDVFSMSLIIRPESVVTGHQTMGILETAGSHGVKIWLDKEGFVYTGAYFLSTASEDDDVTAKAGSRNIVKLRSHTKVSTDGTPTNIIVTFDKYLKSGNLKLFINSKLEDLSGKAYIDSSPTYGNINNWEWGKPINKLDVQYALRLGGTVNTDTLYKGRMEELVFYNHVIYPIIPRDGEFTLSTPLEETDSNGKPISYFAKIFVKDYHNIRGVTTRDVATAPHVHMHKVGLGK